jgi:hypothetical protein
VRLYYIQGVIKKYTHTSVRLYYIQGVIKKYTHTHQCALVLYARCDQKVDTHQCALVLYTRCDQKVHTHQCALVLYTRCDRKVPRQVLYPRWGKSWDTLLCWMVVLSLFSPRHKGRPETTSIFGRKSTSHFGPLSKCRKGRNSVYESSSALNL